MNIYNSSGTAIFTDVPLTTASELVQELMRSDYVQLVWRSASNTIIPAGSYINIGREKYSLIEPYSPEQRSEAEWEYRPQFVSEFYTCAKVPFFMYTTTSGVTTKEADWVLTDNPLNFLTRVQTGILTETGLKYDKVVDNTVQVASATVEFNCMDIISACTSIANAFETELWLEKFSAADSDGYIGRLHLGKAQFGTAVNLEVGTNIKVPSVTKNGEYFNRFYVFGSSRNIVQANQGSTISNVAVKRLTLNPTTYPYGYIDFSNGGPVYSKILQFDEVYPSATDLVVFNLRTRTRYRLDENTSKPIIIGGTEEEPVYDTYVIWYFQMKRKVGSSYIDFYYSDAMALPGLVPSIHFNSGPLAGREFEVIYHEHGGEVQDGADPTPFEILDNDFEIKFQDENGLIIPSIVGLVPQTDNLIVLFNVQMPGNYTTSAQERLATVAFAEINKNYLNITTGEQTDLNSYQVQSDPTVFHTNEPTLALGSKINYINGSYSKETRVTALRKRLDLTCYQTIVFGDEIVKGNIEELKEEAVSANRDIDLLAALNKSTSDITAAYERTHQLILKQLADAGSIWQREEYTEGGETKIRAKLNPALAGAYIGGFVISEDDQIVVGGEPGGGGGGGVLYLNELLDVTITLPSNGQTLFYQDGVWVNGNIDFSNYYTKAQVDDIIGTIQQFHYEVYASLEDVTDPQNNVLYLIGPTGSGEDKYEEYVYSGGWVKIGDTSIDLSGYVQTTRLDADEAIIAEAIQSLQSQIDAVSARDNYDELTASSLYADMLAATYAYAERYYLTDGVFFYIETVNGIPCVKLNAPFITEGDQVIISGTPGGGGGGGITLYDYDQVKAMTADVALTAPSAWAMHQMWAEIFGGASSVLTSGNYTNYVNTTNFPGLDKVGTVTSVATGTGLTGGPITASGTISIDPTYLGYISHGETAYGWGDILTQAIQSLQSQIDSVSARNNYDELTASAFFGDMVSASALYAGRIELAGEDLGTAVTGICSRLSSVENKFDTDGSALSAVKLKTSRNIWGRPFDGTADVTGDLNLNGSSILGTLGNPVLSMAGMNGNYWVALGSMYFETSRYNPMIVGHTYISGSSATPSSIPSETLFVNGTSAFDGNVEIKTGRTLTIGGAVFTWVPAEGDTPGYLRLSTAFVTEGDQIILSGEPGGGGQGVGYLYELEDVSDELATPTTGMVLYYDGTEWIGVAATEIGGVTSVVGASGDVTATQIIDAITEEGLPWSAITEKPTTLAGYGITDAATASSVAALTTRVGTLESDETIISIALQSLQSQVDSVSARNEFDELTATVLFADTLSATSAYIGNITGHLSGNADTASHLISSSYAVGSATQPVYFSGGLPVSCTYSINAATTSGTAGRLAYYAGANAISDFYNTIGGAYQPMYLNAGVPTACTYTLNAAILASSTAGRLAYYSGTNAVSEYYGNIGSGVIPMYLNAGVPTASTSTVGSASLPVYLNAGTITACTAASLFSALGSNTVNNLEVTVAGQLRTITNLYATYDGAGENISDKFTIVSSAIQSLQSQIDSVATRFGTDECIATTAYFDMLSVGAYIYAGALVTTGDQTVASDATLKKNWRGLNYGIEDIARATAGVFDWKDGHGTSAGTIAQEWKELIPELVHGEEGGMSLAYGQAAMLNTILLARHETEQDREIRQLKARVSELETRLKIRS